MDIDDKNLAEESSTTGDEAPSMAKEEPFKKKKTIIKGHKKETEELANKIIDLNDKYIRLSAEFDNYRKRTLREKMDLTKTGGEVVLLKILPVVDNLERAISSIRETTDIEAVKIGIELIYSNFIEFLKQSGVTPILCQNEAFNSDIHEAITKIPVTDPDQKGKVVDVIEKGYYLHERVIRFAKVVVGD